MENKRLVRHLFVQMCQGVHALHTETGHAHLDLKLDNFLVGKDQKLKLCDFG